MKTGHRHDAVARTVLPLSLLIAAMMGGCYRHVVGVKGPGASSYNVYEPHYKPEEERQIEGWFGSIFGQKPADQKKK